MATVRGAIQEIEKTELHVHLEGSIEAETLLELAPGLAIEEVRGRYQFREFAEFLKNFGWVASHLKEPRHYALALRRLLGRLEAQRVTYAEIMLSAGVVHRQGKPLEAIHEALCEEAGRSKVKVVWIWDAVRQWGVEAAWRVVEDAVRQRGNGVVAFGLGGDERNGPAREHRDVFRYAKENGLRLHCHAGEVTGPEAVWEALEVGAERIGHGIRSIEDPALVAHLAARGIPLEICVSSNVATGAVARLEEHPVRRLYEAGVPLIVATDDPPMFGTTLNGEYELLAERFGFSLEELGMLARNGFRYAFAP